MAPNQLFLKNHDAIETEKYIPYKMWFLNDFGIECYEKMNVGNFNNNWFL